LFHIPPQVTEQTLGKSLGFHLDTT
jgi:hypothetical protein